MDTKPHVVRVITTFGVGGVQNQITKIAPLLVNRGYRVTVLALQEDGPLRQVLEESGISTTVLPMQGKYRLWEILRLALWLSRHKCSILHVHRMGGVVFPAVMAGVIAGVRGIVVHHHFLYSWENRRKRLLESFATRLAHRVLGVSQAVALNSIRGLGLSPNRVDRLYNGVAGTKVLPRNETRERLGLPTEDTVCGLVARIVYFKRIQDAIEAVAKLAEKRGDVRLAVVGGGEKARVEKLKRRASELGVKESVLWCGEVEQAASLMGGFDLGLLVSTKEGMPNTLLEYWAAGLPVVATSIPPISEMVSAGGLLVPPRSPEKVAEVVETVLSSPRLSRRMAIEGKTRRGRFSVDATLEATERLYQDLLSS